MKPRLMLLVALGLGLTTSILVYVYMGQLSRPVEATVLTTPVVVAIKPIAPRTPVDNSMVTLRQVPTESQVTGVLTQLSDVVGRVARYAVAPGSQMTDAVLFPKGVEPGLAFTIPPGERAVTVAVNEVKGVAGFIKPGDNVDVLVTLAADQNGVARTMTALQDKTVLAIAQTMQDNTDKAQVVTSVTLAVSPHEAELLALAEQEGTLQLALRPADVSGVSVVPAVSLSELGGGVPTPARTATPVRHTVAAKPQVQIEAVHGIPRNWSVDVIRGSVREEVEVHP